MAKPLSQEEIDILLQVRSQMSVGSETYDIDALESMMTSDVEKRINAYNFKRPRLFSQDQMRVLSHVHEAFARDVSVFLSAQLRTIVDISLTAIDQVLYSEYVMSSAPPAAIFVAEAHDLGQKMIFELDPRFVVFTIEKLFGGPGEFLKKAREVSQIEQRIMGKVMTRAFHELEKAWRQVHEVRIVEETFESNAEFVQILPGVEPAMVCTFEVVVYDQTSFINICYPYLMLERMLSRSAMSQWITSATSDVNPNVRERYEESLRGMNVEMRAELGRTRLAVSELMELEMGDVIPLDRRVTDPIKVFVGSKHTLSAMAGKAGKRRALRVLELISSAATNEDNELE
ncbi:MAG TPA: flagellar motor switch protein FliM [Rhodothermales bacterium]|nr:flagellar motor switch protein FliM [Rhodothermales bacterium]